MVEPNKTTVSDNTESGALNMVKLTIDNCEVVVPEHTTILDAAKSVGIQIPNLKAQSTDSLISVKSKGDTSFVTSGDYQKYYNEMYEEK